MSILSSRIPPLVLKALVYTMRLGLPYRTTRVQPMPKRPRNILIPCIIVLLQISPTKKCDIPVAFLPLRAHHRIYLSFLMGDLLDRETKSYSVTPRRPNPVLVKITIATLIFNIKIFLLTIWWKLLALFLSISLRLSLPLQWRRKFTR